MERQKVRKARKPAVSSFVREEPQVHFEEEEHEEEQEAELHQGQNLVREVEAHQGHQAFDDVTVQRPVSLTAPSSVAFIPGAGVESPESEFELFYLSLEFVVSYCRKQSIY